MKFMCVRVKEIHLIYQPFPAYPSTFYYRFRMKYFPEVMLFRIDNEISSCQLMPVYFGLPQFMTFIT